ncbi:uncharacterized protein PRCAT00001526001 [Priceomyces carsonii]|uniref:uncharacterized protein n=1 Tax=Priceomyces carsonii TaxID=28549 RepID=UPI002ED9911C|nr:unnamed protein product [Priceomyces carsonii]
MRLGFIYILVFSILLLLCSGRPRLEKIATEALLGQIQESKHDMTQKREPSNIFPMDLRSIKDWKLTDLLLVSDIDGNLHGVSRSSGTLLWTLPIDEPLVSIQTNETTSSAFKNNSNIIWLVEPYADGHLYYFSPNYGLNKLPSSIKELVLESPFSLSGDDKIYTGNRKTSLYKVNIHTGEVKSSFGNNDRECPLPNMHHNGPKFEADDTIMIGQTTYELMIHSKENANIVWNVTYNEWGPNKIDNDLIIQNHQSKDDIYFTPFHDKSLLAVNKNIGSPVWISKLPSLTVNVFDVFNNLNSPEHILLPHPLKVLNEAQIENDKYSENNNLVFVNKTADEKDWFAMSFDNYPTLVKSAPISNYQLSLYNLQNSIPIDVNYIRNFDLSEARKEDVENLVCGVHKIFPLSSETMYQPVSRFESPTKFKEITDGRDSQDNEHNRKGNLPTIFEGIQFPNEVSLIESQVTESLLLDNPSNDSYLDGMHREKSGIFSSLRFVILGLGFFILAVKYFLGYNNVYINLGIEFRADRKKKPSENADNGETKRQVKFVVSSNGSKDQTNIAPDQEDEIITALDFSLENYEQVTHQRSPPLPSPSESNLREIKDKESINYGETSDSRDSLDEKPDKVIEDDSFAKKKRKRGSRGGKRSGKKLNKHKIADVSSDGDFEVVEDERNFSKGKDVKELAKNLQMKKNLIISDKILGYGSHGTIVYEGVFESRPVAIKRMLLDFYEIANHEVNLLQESDYHPNVIRYFCSQTSESDKFLYIALELCLCTVEDLFEKSKYLNILNCSRIDYRNMLLQLAKGLDYLHSLKIVHRDLKPQNILVADFKKNDISNLRLLVSDFGLCKKLDVDQSSFRATTNQAALGTSGWRAPELLLNHDLSELSPSTISSNGSSSKFSVVTPSSTRRLTKAIDIFSMGCVFFYILSGGLHPFGDRYLREGNIMKGEFDISELSKKGIKSYVEASDLISSMISFDPMSRPSTIRIMKHPYFWSDNKKLEFLLKVSDRIEIERKHIFSQILVDLELHALKIHNGNWYEKFNVKFMDNLSKYRKYESSKLMDLLRVIRNKYHHFGDMPFELQEQMRPLPEGFYGYFNERFPHLLMEIYFVIEKNLKHEHMFESFF